MARLLSPCPGGMIRFQPLLEVILQCHLNLARGAGGIAARASEQRVGYGRTFGQSERGRICCILHLEAVLDILILRYAHSFSN